MNDSDVCALCCEGETPFPIRVQDLALCLSWHLRESENRIGRRQLTTYSYGPGMALDLHFPASGGRMRHKLVLSALCLVAAMCLVTPQLRADSLTLGPPNCTACNGYQFVTTVTPQGAGFDVSFQITNVSGPNAFLQGFGLTLFDQEPIDATFVSSNPTITSNFNISVVDNSKFNNGNNNCAQSGHDGSFCVTVSSANGGFLLGPHGTILFNFTVTGVNGTPTVLPTWHIMANGTTTPTGTRGGNVFAVSEDGSPTPTVPEPASLMLFGSGMLAIGRTIYSKVRG